MFVTLDMAVWKKLSFNSEEYLYLICYFPIGPYIVVFFIVRANSNEFYFCLPFQEIDCTGLHLVGGSTHPLLAKNNNNSTHYISPYNKST